MVRHEPVLLFNLKRAVTDFPQAPYAWLMGGEYPNNHLRAHTYGMGTALNFLGNWLGVFTAPYFINPASLGWSAKYGYVITCFLWWPVTEF